MSVLGGWVLGQDAPEGLDVRDLEGAREAALNAVLSSIGTVFPEPLFIVDAADTLIWMNLAMADRICRDNALEPDYAVEWLLSQIDDQEEDLVQDSLSAGDTGAIRVVALLDVLGRPEWLTVRICELPCEDRALRMVVLQDITPIKREALALQEEAATLQHSLRHDLATGLASRAALRDRLESVRNGTDKSMIVLEIDGFRLHAARHGGASVNRVLERLAADLADMVEDDCLIARVAEDRFAILGDAAPKDALCAQARMIAEAVTSDHHFPTGRWSLSLRAACACGPARGPGQADLLHRTEDALMDIPSGDDRAAPWIHFDSEDMQIKRRRDASLRASMEGAISGGQMEAFLQPAVLASDGSVAFIEALVRWRHPESGLIPPPFFLQIARDADLICALDLSVSKSALDSASLWHETYGPLPVALNLSLESLRSAQTRTRLLEIVSEAGVKPGDVIFECSGLPVAPGSDPALIEGILALRKAGLRLALEDCGRFQTDPVELFLHEPDIVKIGPAAVGVLAPPVGAAEGAATGGPYFQALRAYLATAAQLGCTLAAVGVQDRAQPEQLSALGISVLQGHLVGRPLAPSRLPAWLNGCLSGDGGGLGKWIATPVPPLPQPKAEEGR